MAPKAPTATDFGAPKKARSPYFVFGDEVRPGIIADLKAKEAAGGDKFAVTMVAGIIAEKWKAVTDKSKYEQITAEEKVKAEEAMKAWNATDGPAKFKEASIAFKKKWADKDARKAAKSSGMPAKPPTVYMLVAEEVRVAMRAAAEPMPIMEVTKRTQAMYAALSAEKKAELEAKVAAAKEKYVEDMKVWEESDACKELKAKELANKQDEANAVFREAKKVAEAAGMPKAPAKSVLALYTQKTKAEKEGATNEEIKAAFQALEPEAKKDLEKELNQLTKEYNDAMKEFKKTDAWKEFNKATKKRERANAGDEAPAAKRAKKASIADEAPEESTTAGDEEAAPAEEGVTA